jgi:hypothetical protein
MEDFRIEFKEEYKTFILKDNHLALERMRFRFESWVRVPYIIEEIYDFQDFTEVTIRKETINFHHKSDQLFLYSLNIQTRKTNKKKQKFIFRNLKAENQQNAENTYIIEYEQFKLLTEALLERLECYPNVKVYAYETIKIQMLKKLDGFFPAMYVGSTVIGGALLLKLFTIFFKISLKFSFLYFLDTLITHIGAVFMLLGASSAYFINRRLKAKAQIKAGEPIPSQFFPSSEKNEKFLTN